MALYPQQLTIYLYSAHRAVIFAIAQLSCLQFTLTEVYSWDQEFAAVVKQESRAAARKPRDFDIDMHKAYFVI